MLPPSLMKRLEKLAAANIGIAPVTDSPAYFVMTRGEFVALVQREPDGFGAVGAPGVLTERGLAVLMWRRGKPFFVAKGWKGEASAEQLEGLRRFRGDLEAALA